MIIWNVVGLAALLALFALWFVVIKQIWDRNRKDEVKLIVWIAFVVLAPFFGAFCWLLWDNWLREKAQQDF